MIFADIFTDAGWDGFGDFLGGFVKWIGSGIGAAFSAAGEWVSSLFSSAPTVTAVLKEFPALREITLAVIMYFVIINIVTFAIFGMDKKRAQNKGQRVSERTLFRLCAAGGALGGLLGMKVFRHKTKHNKFRWGVPVLFFVELIAGSFCIGFLMYWVYM